MSIRTPQRGPTSAGIVPGIVPREQVVAPPVRRGSGHRMTGALTASPRRAVEVPGLWTPGRRRAESEGRRGGRPQALGNFAGDRCRPCLRRGPRNSHTPTAIVILAMINREDEGVTSQPGYTLSKPSNCPNNRDHFKRTSAGATAVAATPRHLRPAAVPRDSCRGRGWTETNARAYGLPDWFRSIACNTRLRGGSATAGRGRGVTIPLVATQAADREADKDTAFRSSTAANRLVTLTDLGATVVPPNGGNLTPAARTRRTVECTTGPGR